MKLLINGLVANLERLPTESGGYVLQILFPEKGDSRVHRRLADAFRWQREPIGGVMDEERPTDSEIRLLEGLELDVIDLARFLGFSVQQKQDD